MNFLKINISKEDSRCSEKHKQNICQNNIDTKNKVSI